VDVPNLAAIVIDGAVGRKGSHTRRIEDRHPNPSYLILVGLGHPILTTNVRLIVGEQKIGVLMEERIEQRTEKFAVPTRELAGIERIDHTAQ
jgi:hypothetical protein